MEGCFSNSHISQVFRQVASWTEGTPLFSCTGGVFGPSYGTAIENLNELSRGNEIEFEDRVIAYACKWKELVTKQYKSSLNELKTAKERLGSYEEDIELFRSKRATTFGKGEGARYVSKLKDQHDHLVRMQNEYEWQEKEFCVLMDELTDDSWKKLYPFLVKLYHFEQVKSRDRAVAWDHLDEVMDRLKGVAKHQNLTMEHLEDESMAELTPSECNSCGSSVEPSPTSSKPKIGSTRTWKSSKTSKSNVSTGSHSNISPPSVTSSDIGLDLDAISGAEWENSEARISIWRDESGWSEHITADLPE